MMEKSDYRLIAKGGKIPKPNDSHAMCRQVYKPGVDCD
jgi:hypothetical protein